MPRFADQIRRVPTNQSLKSDIVDGSDRSAALLGAGLLRRLVRLAVAANEDRADETDSLSDACSSPPNRCEFDYDYYVALQSRRRNAPSRSNPSTTPWRAV